ncbi:MAG: CAP domain-containing protein [Actinomycetota bacterium]|nr:CAP domain-containing protein [Actinomycetota bacterium]
MVKSKKVRIAMGAGLASVMALTVVPEAAFADTGSDEANFVAKLNGLRASKGLRQLGVNGGLTSMARGWSSQMASRGTISHNPNLASQAPSNWVRVGENVGMGQSVDSLHNAFVNSPSHYANMVNGYYDSVGVGVVQSGSTIFVTVNFMASGAAPQVASGSYAPPAAAAPVSHAAPAPARKVCRKLRRGRVVCKRVQVRKVRKGRKATKSRRTVRRTRRR